jgi:uncharacterized protein (TIGR03435 family)
MMPALNDIILMVSTSLAGSIIVKVTVATVLGLIATRLARGNRAAVRHALLAATFAATLLLPIAAVLMPPLHLSVPVGVESRSAMLPLVMGVDTYPSVTPVGAARVTAGALHGPNLSLATLMLAGWGTGVALFLLPVVVGLWQIRSLRRSGLPWRHGQSLVEPLALDAGIRRPVEVLLHEALLGPMACGVAHPAMVLPRDAETWSPDDLNRAMIHELEHVRRGDTLSRGLARVACAVYWFHPLVWIAWRKLMLEAERSCDDAVLGHSEATAYADQLVGLARRLSMVRRLPALAMANRVDLAARVNAVLDNRQKRGRAGATAVLLVCTVVLLLLLVMSLVTLVAAPQAASEKVPFEVASVRAITPEFAAGAAAKTGVRIDGAQFHASMPLRGFVVLAYGARPHQIEAPEWMSSQWYEIAATLPEGHSKTDEWREMLQRLLGERFHMKTHQETKDLPVYALTVTQRGINAKEDPLDPVERSIETVSTGSELSTVARLPRGATLTIGGDKVEAKKFTMGMLADQLTRFVDRPVVDQTDLAAEAAYDLTLELTHEDFLATRVLGAIAFGITPPPQGMKILEASGDSLHAALAKVGLKLEAKKAPMEVLVIDSASKAPGEN